MKSKIQSLLSIFIFIIFAFSTTQTHENEEHFGNNLTNHTLNTRNVGTFDDCPNDKVTFWLFTNQNDTDGEQILVNDSYSNLQYTNFHREWPTKIIVHGFRQDSKRERLVKIKDEYLKKESHNIIAVDWKKFADDYLIKYYYTVRNVKLVGNCTARLIQKLREQNVEDIHAIGYSLGAHVLASAALYLRPYKIDRITGLDPAGPGYFLSSLRSEKLSKNHANFVDVIHTSLGTRGQVGACGHIDFYMNNGLYQPGCGSMGCSHRRSLEYFAESINSKVGFWGWPCYSLLNYWFRLCSEPQMCFVQAGDPVNRTHEGIYFVKTHSTSPFAKGPGKK